VLAVQTWLSRSPAVQSIRTGGRSRVPSGKVLPVVDLRAHAGVVPVASSVNEQDVYTSVRMGSWAFYRRCPTIGR